VKIFLISLLAKIFSYLLRLTRLGTGVTWAGEIALRIEPKILTRIFHTQDRLILVVGTNGKTTTTKMLHHILSQQSKTIFNDTGANMLNGLVGTLLIHSPLFSHKKLDVIFEVDESNLPLVLKNVRPHVVVLLNLFRDQLDRYGEVDTVVKKWHEALSPTHSKTTLIINGDDPQLAWLGKSLKNKKYYFGLNSPKEYNPIMEHATDSTHCPNCGSKLKFAGSYFSHLGDFSCPKCNFAHPKLDLTAKSVTSPLPGLYNEYNTLAATLTAEKMGISQGKISDTLKNFKPAFGRLEEIQKNGKKVKILLSKNPAGFNASLRAYLQDDNSKSLLTLLNDNVADGKDVSWIWDVDFEMITKGNESNNHANANKSIIVSGTRGLDLATRLKYANLKNVQNFSEIKTAIKSCLDSLTNDETLWILATYTAMLEARKVLTGKKIL